MQLLPRPCALVDVHCLPVDVGSAPQREVDHPRAHGLVREPIDENEAAEAPATIVWFKRHWTVDRNVDDTDVVQAERPRRQMRAEFHIDLVLDRRNRRDRVTGVQIHDVRTAGHQGMFGEAQDSGLKLIAQFRRLGGRRNQASARDVDLIFKTEGDGVADFR